MRCSNLGIKCDGKSPCSRCSTSEYNYQQCTYPTTNNKSIKRERAATTTAATGRRPSVSQMTAVSTSSSFGDDDEDMMSISEETPASVVAAFSPFNGNGHGPRRSTVSNMESVAFQSDFDCSFPRSYEDPATATNSWHQHHPFEMPQMETPASSSYLDFKSLHPQQLHQQIGTPVDVAFFDEANRHNDSYSQQQQQQPHHQPSLSLHSHQADNEIPLLSLFQAGTAQDPNMATFDWSSMMQDSMVDSHHQNNEGIISTPAGPLPFSKSASNKALNATLSRGPDHNGSGFLSPSGEVVQKLFPTEQQQQAGAAAALAAAGSIAYTSSLLATGTPNGTVNLASLGLPVPSNLNISVPADLQMSAENWDNLMRCLTMMATRQGGEQPSTL